MPSPYKESHDKAAESIRRLRPKLSEKPIGVHFSPSNVTHEYLKRSAHSKAEHLKKLLNPNPEPPDEAHYPPERHSIRQHVKPQGQIPTPEEAVGIIEHQSAYIRQIESDLRFCQSELRAHHNSLNEVLEENARLISTQHTSLAMKNVLDPIQTNIKQSESVDKRDLSKHIHDLQIMKALHESKTKILEQQLKDTKEKLHEAESLVDEYKSRCVVHDALSGTDGSGCNKFGGICLKCGQAEALIATSYDKTDIVNQLSLEKDELISSLANIRRQYEDMQVRETEAVEKVKISLQVTEQANLDKTQALLQREQMEEELTGFKSRFQIIMNEHREAISRTKQSAKYEVKNEIDEMTRRLEQSNLSESQLKAELEKTVREKEDMNSQLNQMKRELSFYHTTSVESTTGRKIDMTQLACDRDMAVEEKNKLKNRLYKVEQMKDEAILRVKQELELVKTRLEKAERELIFSNEKNLKTNHEKLATEKQYNDLKYQHNSVDRTQREQLNVLERKLEQREDELLKIISENESKYNKQLDELERLYVNQSKLVEELRKECETQAENVRNVSHKYKNEAKQLRHDNVHNGKKLEKYRERISQLETHEEEHENIHKKLRNKLTTIDDDNTQLHHQLNEAVAKAAEYKRELEILTGEVKFLRSQVGDEGMRTSPRLNSSMVDDLLSALKKEMVEQDENLVGSIDILKEASHGDC